MTQLRKLVEALEHLPPTVDEVYNEILHRIGYDDPDKANDKQLAMRTLAWVFYAANKPGARPLRMEELRDLLVIEPNDKAFQHRYRSSPRDIVAVCQSLVIHDEETDIVGLAHFTMHEFLRKCTELPPISYTAEICLTYLSFEVFENGMAPNREVESQRIENYKAAPFVASYWGFFVRDVEESPQVQETVIALLSSEPRLWSIVEMELYEIDKRYNYPESEWEAVESHVKGQKIILFLARQGLVKTLTNLLDRKRDENES